MLENVSLFYKCLFRQNKNMHFFTSDINITTHLQMEVSRTVYFFLVLVILGNCDCNKCLTGWWIKNIKSLFKLSSKNVVFILDIIHFTFLCNSEAWEGGGARSFSRQGHSECLNSQNMWALTVEGPFIVCWLFLLGLCVPVMEVEESPVI